eukprot:6251398-Amphidinium_carterae.1
MSDSYSGDVGCTQGERLEAPLNCVFQSFLIAGVGKAILCLLMTRSLSDETMTSLTFLKPASHMAPQQAAAGGHSGNRIDFLGGQN